MNLESKLRNLKAAVVSHIYSPGPSHEIVEFLRTRVKTLIFIGHPFSYAQDLRSFKLTYQNGQLIKEEYSLKTSKFLILSSLKDTYLNWQWLFKENWDLVVSLDGLNTVTLIPLKFLRKIKILVFYTIDYLPQRFGNIIFNQIYHLFDNWAVKFSDSVWNLSPVMAKMRLKKGIWGKNLRKQMVVPMGTYPLKKLPKNFPKKQVVFMGHLRPFQGLDLLLSAFVLVLLKVKDAKLLILGGGPLEKKLKQKAKDLKIAKKVNFQGFIPTHQQMRRLLKKAALAVAPYQDDPKALVRYGDPSKVKEYLAQGLPVVMTKIPHLITYQLERAKAGIVVDFSEKELSDKIIFLLKNQKTLLKYRQNTLKLASQYTWQRIYTRALKKVLY